MDDQIVAVGWDRHVPDRALGHDEGGRRVVELPDDSPDARQLVQGCRAESVPHLPGHPTQQLTSLIIGTDVAGSVLEALALEMLEKGVHGRGGGSGGPADGVPDPHHLGGDVATGERFLDHAGIFAARFRFKKSAGFPMSNP